MVENTFDFDVEVVDELNEKSWFDDGVEVMDEMIEKSWFDDGVLESVFFTL
jgi:hypothetical protein